MKYCVYVIKNQSGKIYIGHTNYIDRRIFEHNNRLSTYTSKYPGPWILVYQEEYDNRAEAMKREKYLKTGVGRKFIKSVIDKHPQSSGVAQW